MPMIPYPRRLADLAVGDPDRPAITDEHRTVTRAELETLASDTAEEYASLGVGQGDIVVVALPNCIEFLAATIAITDSDGRELESLNEEELASVTSPSGRDYETLVREIHQSARRVALGTDDAIERILRAMGD